MTVSQVGNLYIELHRLQEATLRVPLEGRKEGRKEGTIFYFEKFGDYKK